MALKSLSKARRSPHCPGYRTTRSRREQRLPPPLASARLPRSSWMAAGSNSIAFFLGLAFLTVFSGCPWQRLCIGVSSHTQLLSPPSVSTAIAMPAPSAADGSLEGASGAPANLLAGCAAYFKASYHHLASAKKHGTPLAEIISTMFKSSEIFGLPVGRKIDTKKRAPPMLVAHRTLLKNCFLQSMEHRYRVCVCLSLCLSVCLSVCALLPQRKHGLICVCGPLSDSPQYLCVTEYFCADVRSRQMATIALNVLGIRNLPTFSRIQ